MKRLAHYSDIVLLASQAFFVLSLAVVVGYWNWWGTTVLSVLATLLMLVGFVSMVGHNAGPCALCITEMPLDAHAQVERRQWTLRTFHILNARPVLAAWIATVTLSFLLPRTWEVPILAVFAVLNGLDWWCTWRHRPLQPACPWCRWGDGGDGDHEVAPDPRPNPAETRTA